MKTPRNLSGKELAGLLKKFGYKITRQTGSHLRLTTAVKGEHHITIPNHRPIKIGTLNNILTDIAAHLEMPKEELAREIFSRK